MSESLEIATTKVKNQIEQVELPITGTYPFRPKLVKNKRNELIIEKKTIVDGPKRNKKGYVDVQGNIWIKDHAHAGYPEHWDVQINDGREYYRIGLNGEPL